MRLSPSLAALAAVGGIVEAALPTIEAVGNKFFTKDGKQFFMKGVAYQLIPDDPLVDVEQCTRDAKLMKTLGANTIRVYHVDADADHDGCMAAFDDAGIYALIDMDTFSTYILPDAPGWTEAQLTGYTRVMDTFSKYDNLLGLFVGNEIISQAQHSGAAPYIKAAVRDTKAHLKARGYRDIPVGYSAADIAELRPMLQDYLTCGGNASENIDFFALNSYEWCDPATYATSGYAKLNEQAKDFPVPIFFSETGCNQPGPRLFDDQAAIFGPEMVSDWSGAMIYEWIEEANHYGLISYGPKVDPTVTGPNIDGGFTRKGEPTPVTPDFDNLKMQWAKITPTGIARSDYDPKHVSTRACPSATAGGWLINGNVPLPTLNAKMDVGPAGSSSPNPSGSGSSSGSASGSVPSSGSISGSSSGPSSESNTGTPASGAAEPTTSPDNAVSGSREFTGMTAGLLSVMLIFTFWL